MKKPSSEQSPGLPPMLLSLCEGPSELGFRGAFQDHQGTMRGRLLPASTCWKERARGWETVNLHTNLDVKTRPLSASAIHKVAAFIQNEKHPGIFPKSF